MEIQGHGSFQPRLANLADRHIRQIRHHERRCPPPDASHPAAHSQRKRGERRVRRHHLPERRRVFCGCTKTPERTNFAKAFKIILARIVIRARQRPTLWKAPEEVSGKPIRAISTGWTEQPGLPVVKMDSDCTNSELVVSLEQERLLVDTVKSKPVPVENSISLLDASHSTTRHPPALEWEFCSMKLPDWCRRRESKRRRCGLLSRAILACAF